MMPPFGMKENQTRAGQFLDAEQVELLADLAVVALLRFFQLVQVLVKIFFGKPGRAVNPLKLFVLLVAFPICAGNGEST